MKIQTPRRSARTALALACLAGLLAPLHAQTHEAPPLAASVAETPALSIAQLTRIALEANPGVRAAERSVDAASAAVTTASAWQNPRIEFNSGRNSARQPGVAAGSTGSWALSQTIESPALREARMAAANASRRGSAEQLQQARNELVAQVRLRAYELLLRQAEAGAAADSLALLEQVRERVRLRVDSGEAPRYEIIKADVEIVNARQRQATAALQAEQAKVALNRLAAGRLPVRWTLAARLDEVALPASLDELQRQAQQHNPELKALQAEFDRARAQLEFARAGRWPGVELRYGQGWDPELNQRQIGVGVQLPLLDPRSGPIAEASAELERARIRLEGRGDELRQQLLLAWKSLEIARLRVQALGEGSVREAESALKVAQAAYRYGERGILDVLDAQRVLRSTRAELLDARYQQQAALVELELAVGRIAEAPSL